jgi:hypothetical protein
VAASTLEEDPERLARQLLTALNSMPTTTPHFLSLSLH